MTDSRMAHGSRETRAKLLVVLPLTMALLVGATGFYTLHTARRAYERRGPIEVVEHRLAPLGVQISAISAIAAILGFGVALGVTRPVRQITRRLEALASGDLRGELTVASTRELDSLGGAFNDALSALQRHYMQALTGAVITLDADGRVIGSSTAAEVTLGYREEDLAGRHVSDVFTPASGSRDALVAVERAIARREPVAVDDIEILAADGRPVRIGISASYLHPLGSGAARSREVIGVTLQFKDLNEMRELRVRLQQADQLMSLGTVTAGVAHEIRNPLASLRGLTELIGRDDGTREARRRYVEAMLASIDRLNRLIEDLLLFSSRGTPEAADVELIGLTAETVAMTRVGLGERALDILIAPGAPRSAVVRGCRERIAQALTNVILNATQAAPDGGVVTVRIEQHDGCVRVAVHNTGSFIPPDVRRQLFVPFFTTRRGGTGLGLAIARRIVTAMEGRIEVASDPDTGTTFTMVFPLVAVARAA